MLARENQLLKEQLGKVLRLHESEKALIQVCVCARARPRSPSGPMRQAPG